MKFFIKRQSGGTYQMEAPIDGAIMYKVFPDAYDPGCETDAHLWSIEIENIADLLKIHKSIVIKKENDFLLYCADLFSDPSFELPDWPVIIIYDDYME